MQRGNNNNNNKNTSNNNLLSNGNIKSDVTDLSSLSRSFKNHSNDLDKLQKEAMMAIQQQMAMAAMAKGLLPGGATPWTPSLPSSSSPVHLNINPSLQASGVLGGSSSVISSSSPGGGSGSSGPTSSSGTIGSGSHLEAGKGYTFEEQFKQVSHSRATHCPPVHHFCLFYSFMS